MSWVAVEMPDESQHEQEDHYNLAILRAADMAMETLAEQSGKTIEEVFTRQAISWMRAAAMAGAGTIFFALREQGVTAALGDPENFGPMRLWTEQLKEQ